MAETTDNPVKGPIEKYVDENFPPKEADYTHLENMRQSAIGNARNNAQIQAEGRGDSASNIMRKLEDKAILAHLSDPELDQLGAITRIDLPHGEAGVEHERWLVYVESNVTGHEGKKSAGTFIGIGYDHESGKWNSHVLTEQQALQVIDNTAITAPKERAAASRQLMYNLVNESHAPTPEKVFTPSELLAFRSQAGAATTEHLIATSGLAAVGIGAKALAASLLPAVAEGVALGWGGNEVIERAEHKLQTGHLTQAQFNIISDITKQTVATATAVSMAPDPTGLTSDKAVQFGDQQLIAALEKSGLSKQQAAQYQMGSMTGALDKGAQYLVNRFSNDNEVNQEVALNGSAPLSMALNIHPSQLKELGAMSEKLGGNALQTEVARNSDFAQLAHLTPKELSHLGSLAAAGIDPKVTVSHDKISMLSQQPALSANPKTAFEQAVTYIVQSGDSEFRAPKNADPFVQGTIKNFAELYTYLNLDGGLSKHDIQALSLASEKFASGIEQQQQQQTQLAMH